MAQNVIQTLPIRYGVEEEVYRAMMDNTSYKLRVASPGVIQSYDSTKQTATVQLATMEKVNLNGQVSWKNISTLLDVPVLFPRANGFSITFPIKKGDECLVIFADCCIDGFWQSGGVGNTQLDKRRHDLSDGMAIITNISQPNKLTNVSTTSLQLRSDDGNTKVDISTGNITLTATNVTINSNNVTIAGKNFLSHTHSGVQTGSGNTGSVV